MAANKKSWFTAKANGASSAEIAIYNDIGAWGVTAQDFYDSLKGVGPVDNMDILISSDGGDVTVGFTIYDMLARHSAYKTVRVQGLAASMASVIAMAGDEVVMPSNAFLMIHNPWGAVIGESDELRNFADVLAMMRTNILDAYVKRTGLDSEEVGSMMDAESWITADKAVKLGFADRVDDPVAISAGRFNLAKFNKVPKLFGAHSKESNMSKANDAANSGEDNGGEAVVTTTREELVAETKEIRSLVKLAGQESNVADKFIEEGKSVSEVIEALAKMRDEAAAKDAESRTNANHNARSGQNSQAKAVDRDDIYKRFNKAKR